MSELRDNILRDVRVTPHVLHRIIATAHHRYKVFRIPKRNSSAFREVAQPAMEVKLLQKWLINYLQSKLPVHDSAVAYCIGKGIKHNATIHKENRYVLKLDFKNFFPSISGIHIKKHIKKHCALQFTEEELNDMVQILCWTAPHSSKRVLCVGAPSSPFISNSILFEFDTYATNVAKKYDAIYTRYADDLTFSSNSEFVVSKIESEIRSILEVLKTPKLSINDDKTVHTSRGRGITITGIVVTPEKQLSIGRERKRLISSMVDYFLKAKLSFDDVQKLNGLLAFAYDIEPDFIRRLKTKYGHDIVSKIRSVAVQIKV